MLLRESIAILIATCFGLQVAPAQTISLSLASATAAPAEVISLDIALRSAGSTKPASLQWQLQYAPSDFDSVEVVAGPAAVAARKSVVCQVAIGSVSCVSVGVFDGQINKNPIEDGTIAQVRLQISSRPENPRLPVRLVNVIGASLDGKHLPSPDADGMVDVDQVGTLSELRCDPSWVSTPGSTNCTVLLSAPAPEGDITVALTADTELLSFPDSVKVLSGRTDQSFTVTAAMSPQRRSATLAAQLGSSRAEAILTLAPPIKLTSLSCESTQMKPGASAVCAIRLSDAAPPAGATITVLSSDGSLQAPELIHVRSGQSNPRFRVDVSPIAMSQTISVTANLDNSKVEEDIIVSAGVVPILILPEALTAIHGEQLRLQLVAQDPRGLPVTFSGTSLPAGSMLTSTGEFVWTPQLSHRGTNTVRFWATNSSGLSTSHEVAIQVVDRKPVLAGMANAASLSAEGPCSPGGLATIFGVGITENPPKSASGTPLPSTLSDVRVKVNGQPVSLLFVSSTQVNFQCPVLASGSPLEATVESGLGVSTPLHTSMQEASPGIFTLDGGDPGQGSIIVADRQTAAMIRNASLPSEPAMPGDYVAIFATGLGAVSSTIVEGQAGPADPLATMQGHIEAWIGGQPAEVQFAGLAPGLVGTYQVNAKVPAHLSTADRTPVSLLLRLPDGSVLESNEVTMAIEAN